MSSIRNALGPRRLVPAIALAYVVAIAVGTLTGFAYFHWVVPDECGNCESSFELESDRVDDYRLVAVLMGAKAGAFAGAVVGSLLIARWRGVVGVAIAATVIVLLTFAPSLLPLGIPEGSTGEWGVPYWEDGHFIDHHFVGDSEWRWAVRTLPVLPVAATLISFALRKREAPLGGS